jgi:uncharacterized protein HemX
MLHALIGWAARLGLGAVLKYAGYFLIAVALAAVIVWLGWSRTALRADLDRARAEATAALVAHDSARAALKDLRAVIEAQELALAERERELNELAAQSQAWRRKWQEAKRNDQDTQDWADAPLPAAVRGMLR